MTRQYHFAQATRHKDALEKIKKFPDGPGVYIFKHGQKILYIGKATSLRDRVRSYFNADIVATRSPLVSKMLAEFDLIEHVETDSVLEALVLEAHLIKKYQPEANIDEKDDKSFNFVVITKEDFPRVLIMRGRELLNSHFRKTALMSGVGGKMSKMPFDMGKKRLTVSKSLFDTPIGYSFGPFPQGGQLKEALKIVRKMFPYRDDKCVPCTEQLARKSAKVGPLQAVPSRSDLGVQRGCKPCFNRQIGLCPGVCTGEISQEEYTERIRNIILFFEGNKKRLIRNLEKEMKAHAKKREFEKAAGVKKTLFTLTHIQDVSLIKEEYHAPTVDTFRIESYDIAHLSGTDVVGVMTVVEDGEVKLSDYRKFKIRGDLPLREGSAGHAGVNDTKALAEVLTRRLAHIEWRMPDLIVVDGGTAQKRAIEKVLRENLSRIPVVSVVKDEHHRPREILGDKKWLVHEREIILSNSEAHRFAIGYHKKLRDRL
jgi:excinuclease ABC subunit C